MPFTVLFSDAGQVLRVFSVDKITSGGDEVFPVGIGGLTDSLRGKIVLDTKTVQILQIFDPSEIDDPCIIQGGQLWCW
jgi:hypothetical protein